METQKMLQKVGDRNKYQIYSIIFVSAKWLVVSLTVFLPSYLFMAPTFTCGDMTNVKEIDACEIIDTCTIQQPYTITNYAGLYCDNLYIRNSIISSQFIGSVVGLIILSILADKLGRKVIIVTTLFLSTLGTTLLTIGAHYKIFPLIYVGIIMTGFGGYSLTMVSFSFLSEVSCDKWRQRSLIMTYAFWAVGEILLYPIISYLTDWLYICVFIFVVPLVTLFLMSLFLVQTPEFYYVQKRYDECLQSLNYIAKFNGKQPLDKLERQGHQEQQKLVVQLKDTFSSPKYLIPLIVLSLAQLCNNGFYYTIQYSLDNYGYRFEINMLVIGCIEFASCIFTNFFCQRMKRKFWIVVLMMLSGGFGLLVQITQNKTLDIVFLAFSRLFNTVGFALFGLISSETFPTAIRSTGLGITEAMSNLGNMAAPFLVTLSQFTRVKSVFIGGFLNIGGGLLMLLVKETKVDSKANEKEQAKKQNLGTQQNIQKSLLTQDSQTKEA